MRFYVRLYPVFLASIVPNLNQVAAAISRFCVGSRTVFFREHFALLLNLPARRLATPPVLCQPLEVTGSRQLVAPYLLLGSQNFRYRHGFAALKASA